MNISLTSLLLAGFLVSASVSASADETVYRWYDSNGTPHFSKEPPANTKYETITTKSIASPVSRDQADAVAENDEADIDDKYSAQLSRLAKQRQESCQMAKKNKERLLNNHRIQMKDADGNLKTLSHEEKLEQLKRADEGIQEYCD